MEKGRVTTRSMRMRPAEEGDSDMQLDRRVVDSFVLVDQSASLRSNSRVPTEGGDRV